MQKITPFLWFNDNAEEAIRFYSTIFKNSKVGEMTRYGDAGPGPKGSLMTASFELNGQAFIALNGGPQFTFTEAISFVINCENQDEVDYYWQKLTEGGQPSMCGWLKDKFGLWWQVVPTALSKLLRHKDPEKARRVLNAMLKMQKLDVNVLEEA